MIIDVNNNSDHHSGGDSERRSSESKNEIYIDVIPGGARDKNNDHAVNELMTKQRRAGR